MRTAEERKDINRVLASHGLGQLEDGPGLLAQLGFLVEDDEHFRQLLVRCGPECRREMYESMRPYLRFTAKPLDVYIAEAQRIAEERQWPTVHPETGALVPFRVAAIGGDARDIGAAQAALEEEYAKGHLELTCRKCTRVETFAGLDKADAVWKARQAGWTYGLDTEGKGREICPAC